MVNISLEEIEAVQLATFIRIRLESDHERLDKLISEKYDLFRNYILECSGYTKNWLGNVQKTGVAREIKFKESVKHKLFELDKSISQSCFSMKMLQDIHNNMNKQFITSTPIFLNYKTQMEINEYLIDLLAAYMKTLGSNISALDISGILLTRFY